MPDRTPPISQVSMKTFSSFAADAACSPGTPPPSQVLSGRLPSKADSALWALGLYLPLCLVKFSSPGLLVYTPSSS